MTQLSVCLISFPSNSARRFRVWKRNTIYFEDNKTANLENYLTAWEYVMWPGEIRSGSKAWKQRISCCHSLAYLNTICKRN